MTTSYAQIFPERIKHLSNFWRGNRCTCGAEADPRIDDRQPCFSLDGASAVVYLIPATLIIAGCPTRPGSLQSL